MEQRWLRSGGTGHRVSDDKQTRAQLSHPETLISGHALLPAALADGNSLA